MKLSNKKVIHDKAIISNQLTTNYYFYPHDHDQKLYRLNHGRFHPFIKLNVSIFVTPIRITASYMYIVCVFEEKMTKTEIVVGLI